MDFLTPMIEKYKKQFKNPVEVLDWIEHDLRHLGLDTDNIRIELKKARKILGVK